MDVQTITETPRAHAAAEITVDEAPELPAQSPADRIEQYLAENPPSALTFGPSLPLSAMQHAIEKYRWHAMTGREILAEILSRGFFRWRRSPVAKEMSVIDLIDCEYQFYDPRSYDNQINARHSATTAARDAVWESAQVQSLAGVAEHLGLTQRQVLAQINQTVAAEATVLFRRIGIAKP